MHVKTKSGFRILLFGVLLGCYLAPRTQAQMWQKWAAVQTGGVDAKSVCLTLDQTGNVCVAGYSDYPYTTNRDVEILKYNSDGALQWMARYDCNYYTDMPKTIGVDPDNNVYVICNTQNGVYQYGMFQYYDTDVRVLKYNPAGTLIDQIVSGYADWTDETFAAELDASGNSYFGVEGYNGVGTYHRLQKYDNVGTLLWSSDVGNRIFSLKVKNGEIYTVQANVEPYGLIDTMEVCRYNSAGVLQWRVPCADIYPRDVAADPAGNVFALGDLHPYGYTDAILLKFNSDGVHQWTQVYSGSGMGGDFAVAVEVDEAGYAYATVSAYTSIANHDISTAKISPTGEICWGNSYNGASGGEDFPKDLKVDSEGSVYVTGEEMGVSNYDAVTLKYGAAGRLQWAMVYNGAAGVFDEAAALCCDARRNVYVTGRTGLNYLTIKYVPTLDITLSPIGGPPVIPQSGGSIDYNIRIVNNADVSVSSTIWTALQDPNGVWTYPLLGPFNFTLGPLVTLNRTRTLNVPPGAAPGMWIYEGRVGEYPTIIWDTGGFGFTVLPAEGDNCVLGSWGDVGESFPAAPVINDASKPLAFTLDPCFPNPFNAAAALTFTLPQPSQVNLEVFDVNGRAVVGAKHSSNASPLPAWYPAGAHTIPFDGSDLPSGIYFAKLTAGDYTAIQKLVLLK